MYRTEGPDRDDPGLLYQGLETAQAGIASGSDTGASLSGAP